MTAQNDKKLSIKTKALYGTGQIVWGVKDTIFHFYLIFYYSQTLGLPGTLAGLAGLIALVFDAVSDPVMAYISDGHRSDKGRRHPFMMWSAVPFGLVMFLLMNPLPGLGEIGLFLWLTVFAILARLLVTAYTVPHMALGAELSRDYRERAQIFGYRVTFGYLGGMVLQAIALGVLLPEDKGGMLYAPGYISVGILAGAMAAIAGLVSAWGTRDQVPHLPKAPSKRPPLKQSFADMAGLARMASFRAFMGGAVIYQIVIGVAEALIFFLFTFYYGFTPIQSAAVILLIFIALVPAYWVAQKLVARFDKGPAAFWALLIGSILGTTHVTMRLFDLLPPPGSAALFAIVGSIVVLNQTFIIAYVIIQGSMIGDMADENALATGRRQEGLFAAAQTFVQKLAFGIGAQVAGIVIDWVGFQKGMAFKDVSSDMITRFGWFVGPGLFAFSLFAAWFYRRYQLDEARHAAIQKELADRGL